MKRLKKMPVSIRKQLEKSGEMIANGEQYCICGNGFKRWLYTEEGLIVKPDEISNNNPWWGYRTLQSGMCSSECIAARLMGIAIMITMPEEIINHECSQK